MSPPSLPLYGVPFAVKDNIDGAGLPSTAACPAFAYTPAISATVVQRLLAAGAVLPKTGWQVAPLGFNTFDALYDLRGLIECHAVQHPANAAGRATLQTLAAMWLVPLAERLADGAEMGRQDERFHMRLVQGSGNGEMARVHREIIERIRIIARLDFTKPARVEATHDEHARILQAITRRRADEAQRLLRAHIEQSKLEARHITLAMLYRARQRLDLA